MTSSIAPYPPPLSAAPTVGTLRELLDALTSGTYEVPPVPPLPTAVPLRMHQMVQWRVEHVGSGVPVQLSIGDDLDVEGLRHLRDLLGARWWDDAAAGTATGPRHVASTSAASTSVAATSAARTSVAGTSAATGPAPVEAGVTRPLSWAAGAAAGEGRAAATPVGAALTAAVAAVARFLDAVGRP